MLLLLTVLAGAVLSMALGWVSAPVEVWRLAPLAAAWWWLASRVAPGAASGWAIGMAGAMVAAGAGAWWGDLGGDLSAGLGAGMKRLVGSSAAAGSATVVMEAVWSQWSSIGLGWAGLIVGRALGLLHGRATSSRARRDACFAIVFGLVAWGAGAGLERWAPQGSAVAWVAGYGPAAILIGLGSVWWRIAWDRGRAGRATGLGRRYQWRLVGWTAAVMLAVGGLAAAVEAMPAVYRAADLGVTYAADGGTGDAWRAAAVRVLESTASRHTSWQGSPLTGKPAATQLLWLAGLVLGAGLGSPGGLWTLGLLSSPKPGAHRSPVHRRRRAAMRWLVVAPCGVAGAAVWLLLLTETAPVFAWMLDALRAASGAGGTLHAWSSVTSFGAWVGAGVWLSARVLAPGAAVAVLTRRA